MRHTLKWRVATRQHHRRQIDQHVEQAELRLQISPSTHFVSFAQSILYRGAGIDVVWREFLAVAVIGGLFFGLAIIRFRSVASQTG